jgi:magnesium transporter
MPKKRFRNHQAGTPRPNDSGAGEDFETGSKKRRSGRQQPRYRQHIAPGAVPGQMVIDPSAARPVIHVFAYNEQHYVEQEIRALAELEPLIQQWDVVWINVDGFGDANVITELGRIFKLHPLALEDVVNTLQRPKVDDYDYHLFITARMIRLDQRRLDTEQLSIFLGGKYVLTFQDKPGDSLEPVRERIRKNQGRIRSAGADHLAYSILDAVIDGYFPVLDEYAERLEVLDEQIAERDSNETIQRIHEMRGDLLLLRRAIWPHRDAINALIRDPHPLVADETRIYLRDVLDHITAIIDLTETYREMCSDLRDYALAMVSNRLNAVMKVLTVIATVFMPLSFIASVYGMNFDPNASPWNMPELRWRWGYPWALSLMVTVAVGLLYLFYRRGWIGRSYDTSVNHDDGRWM